MGIEDFGGYGGHIGYVGMGWDGCEGAWVGEVVLKLIWKVQGPLTQSQAFLTHPGPSYPSQTFHTTLCHPDQFQYPLDTHPNPFTPI